MADSIENRMVLDHEWQLPPEASEEEKNVLDGPGWVNAEGGVFVPEEDAFAYALEQCVESIPEGLHGIKWQDDFKEMLVDWFYSSWIWEE